MNEMFSAAVAFLKADAEFTKLLIRSVEHNGMEKPGMSERQLQALTTARARKGTLEAELFRIIANTVTSDVSTD